MGKAAQKSLRLASKEPLGWFEFHMQSWHTFLIPSRRPLREGGTEEEGRDDDQMLLLNNLRVVAIFAWVDVAQTLSLMPHSCNSPSDDGMTKKIREFQFDNFLFYLKGGYSPKQSQCCLNIILGSFSSICMHKFNANWKRKMTLLLAIWLLLHLLPHCVKSHIFVQKLNFDEIAHLILNFCAKIQ